MVGLLNSPTAPTATQKHIAYKINNGVIYASCGDGTNGNLQDTGSTFSQYVAHDFMFIQRETYIQFYLSDVLKVTFTTYMPTAIKLYPVIYMLNSAAVDKSINCYPMAIVQNTGA